MGRRLVAVVALTGLRLGAIRPAVAGDVAAAVRDQRSQPVEDVVVVGTRPGLVHPRWSYTYVLATATTTDLPDHRSWEVAEHRWLSLDEVTARRGDLQRDLARDWPGLVAALR